MILEILAGTCVVSSCLTYFYSTRVEKNVESNIERFESRCEVTLMDFLEKMKCIERNSKEDLVNFIYHLYVGDNKSYEANLKSLISDKFRNSGHWMCGDIVIDPSRDPCKSVPIKEIMYKTKDKQNTFTQSEVDQIVCNAKRK